MFTTKYPFFLLLFSLLLVAGCGNIYWAHSPIATSSLHAATTQIAAASDQSSAQSEAELAYEHFSIPDGKKFTAWSPYTNYQYHFGFMYPDDYAGNRCWIKTQSTDSLATSTLKQWAIGSRIELSVNSTSDSLEKYAANSLGQVAIEEKTHITVGGVKALKIGFRFGGLNRYGEAVFIPYNHKMYRLQYTAGSFACGFELNVFAKIIETFNFSKVPVYKPTLVFTRHVEESRHFKLDADFPSVTGLEDNIVEGNLNSSLVELEVDIHNWYRSPDQVQNVYRRRCSPITVNEELIKFQCIVQMWYGQDFDEPRTDIYSLNAHTAEWIKE